MTDKNKLDLTYSIPDSLEWLSKLELGVMDAFIMCSVLKAIRDQQAKLDKVKYILENNCGCYVEEGGCGCCEALAELEQ